MSPYDWLFGSGDCDLKSSPALASRRSSCRLIREPQELQLYSSVEEARVCSVVICVRFACTYDVDLVVES